MSALDTSKEDLVMICLEASCTSSTVMGWVWKRETGEPERPALVPVAATVAAETAQERLERWADGGGRGGGTTIRRAVPHSTSIVREVKPRRVESGEGHHNITPPVCFFIHSRLGVYVLHVILSKT